LSIKSFTNNTNNIKKERKIYKTDTEFPKVGCWALASCQQLPGSPRLDLAVGRNWAQELADSNLRIDSNLDQDRR